MDEKDLEEMMRRQLLLHWNNDLLCPIALTDDHS